MFASNQRYQGIAQCRIVVLERKLGVAVGVHQLSSDRFPAVVPTSFALARGGALVCMACMSEDASRARRRIGRHKLPMLWETQQCLVAVVIPAERGNDATVQVVQESFRTAGLLGVGTAIRGRCACAEL